MSRARRLLAAAVLGASVAAGCSLDPTPQPSPVPTPSPAGPSAAVATPGTSESAFKRSAWPAWGSACELDGYTGRLGRIEAVTSRTIRFELCRPDGAFPARLAHPALGIVDASSIAMLEADPSATAALPGAGDHVVDAWTPGDNVRLAARSPGDDPAAADDATRPIILRFAASAADRVAALQDAQVDGIADPGPTGLGQLATLPEVTLLPRPGLATAYLGFGAGQRFSTTAVRTGIAQGIDTAGLTRDAFPPGSEAAGWLTPCAVPGGCAGETWYEFNGPAGVDALERAGFPTRARVRLHIPDAPVPGLPDPPLVAATIRDQVAESLGVMLEVDVMPAAELGTGIADGTVDDLYLWGIASSLADPSGFLEPVVGPGVRSTAATLAKAARRPLREAAALADGAGRTSAFAAANDAVRDSVAVVPLAHPGSMAAYRSDVGQVAVSPLGADPLATAVPGDRGQLVLMQSSEPPATWCGIAPDLDSLRLCALVTPGLYAFPGGGLVAEPALASRCTPAPDTTTWTCRLRGGLTFSDGKVLDSGDVLASFRAQADATGRLRGTLPATSFAAWDDLFGGPVPEAARAGG